MVRSSSHEGREWVNRRGRNQHRNRNGMITVMRQIGVEPEYARTVIRMYMRQHDRVDRARIERWVRG